MTKVLKFVVIAAATVLGLASILLTAIFSSNTIDVNFGTIVVGAIFLVYALFTLYGSSVLLLLASFWSFPRKIIWFLAVSGIIYFVFVLNNILIFLGGGSNALVLFLPLVFYLFASFRFFRKLARGRT